MFNYSKIIKYNDAIKLSPEEKLNMKFLDLRKDVITDINELYKFTNITNLRIEDCSIKNVDSLIFNNFAKLKILFFMGNNNTRFPIEIFDMELEQLNLDPIFLKDFFRKSIKDSKLTKSLKYLSFKNYWRDYDYINTFDVGPIEYNTDICNYLYYKKLKDDICYFVNCSHHEITNCDKNWVLEYEELVEKDKALIVLYKDDECYVFDKQNANIKIDDGVKYLFIDVYRDCWDFAYKEELKIINNLPNTLESLIINCKCEHHDNMFSQYEAYNATNLDNLPPSLKYFKIINVEQECIDKIRVPFDCVFEYKLYIDKN